MDAGFFTLFNGIKKQTLLNQETYFKQFLAPVIENYNKQRYHTKKSIGIVLIIFLLIFFLYWFDLYSFALILHFIMFGTLPKIIYGYQNI